MAWRRSHIEHWSVDHDTARETTYIGIVDEDDVPVLIAIQANGDDRIDEIANLARSAPELLNELREARTTLSILRTQVMVEIGRCADPGESRWDGVPEKLKERLDAIDTAIAGSEGIPA